MPTSCCPWMPSAMRWRHTTTTSGRWRCAKRRCKGGGSAEGLARCRVGRDVWCGAECAVRALCDTVRPHPSPLTACGAHAHLRPHPREGWTHTRVCVCPTAPVPPPAPVCPASQVAPLPPRASIDGALDGAAQRTPSAWVLSAVHGLGVGAGGTPGQVLQPDPRVDQLAEAFQEWVPCVSLLCLCFLFVLACSLVCSWYVDSMTAWE